MTLQEIYNNAKNYDGVFTMWFPEYQASVGRFFTSAKTGKWNIVLDEFIVKRQNSIASIKRAYFTKNEVNSIIKDWDTKFSKLFKLISENTEFNRELYEKIEKELFKYTSKKRWAAARRLIASFQPAILSTFVSGNKWTPFINKFIKKFNAPFKKTNNWYIDNDSLISYLKSVVKFDEPWHVSVFPWYLHEYFLLEDKKEKKAYEEKANKLFDFNKSINQNKMRQKHPLNQILYGPPGTGKTYHTINKAIEIANPEFDLKQEREKVKEEYDRLVEEKQIVFTTFHQSMSYEDFIEGIKPKMKTTKKGDIEYEIKDGIFKEISKNAFLNIIQTNEENEILTFENLWDDFLEEIKQYEGKEEYIFSTISEKRLKLVEIKSWKNLFVQFENSGSKGISKASAILTANKDKIKTLFEKRVIPEDVKVLKTEIKPLINSHMTLHFAVYKKFWEFVNKETENIDELIETDVDFEYIFESLKNAKEKNELKSKIENSNNYVLIIDEINRGNVSSIFGELITSIEEDKRIGKDEELKITLPYSKEQFGVPPNLHIIGTMNTADRSIEALDTALRRRFTFKEMPPKSNVIIEEGVLKDKKGILDGINLAKMLDTINKRIQKLIDKDHKIGHSYLMNVATFEELRISFKDKIIPLLEEYFYGDFGKIGLVLGNDFIVEQNQADTFDFATFKAYDVDIIDDFKQRKVYGFTNHKTWEAENFINIYKNTKAE